MPVSVVKHCIRKFSVSSTSSPDGGSGRVRKPPLLLVVVGAAAAPTAVVAVVAVGVEVEVVVEMEARLEAVDGGGCRGLRRAVIAWTLLSEWVSIFFYLILMGT
jgi:hypothetical protein